MKFLLNFCCIILMSTLFSCISADTANCSPGKNVKLLHSRNVVRPALKGLAQDVYVAYPKDGEPTNPNIEIVDFCVHDHDPNLFGAKPVFAYSVDDDVDRRLGKATIILRGQESRGINSTVEFYGFN